MAAEERRFQSQNLILEDRKRLTVTGVEEVDGFDEAWVQIRTAAGELTVRGEGLHVELLSVETGELRITGEISEMSYAEPTERRGLLGRLVG